MGLSMGTYVDTSFVILGCIIQELWPFEFYAWIRDKVMDMQNLLA